MGKKSKSPLYSFSSSKKNNLNKFGKKISQLNYYEFCSMVFYDYIKPYVEEIFPILNKDNNIELNDLVMQIKEKHDGKDVLFVTQAGRRYVSSWLNIFRDDFGFKIYLHLFLSFQYFLRISACNIKIISF